MKKHYGRRIHMLQRGMDQTMTNALASMELTAAQGRIMGYIAHRPKPPCPRDIEDEFRLSHPTVSGILSRLEKKGFIELRPDEQDRRCKRIYILEKGHACTELMHQTIRNNENQMVSGFTPEELEVFSAFLDRAITNMGISLCCPKHKEDEITND